MTKHPAPEVAQGPEPVYDKILSGYRTFHHPDPFERFRLGGYFGQGKRRPGGRSETVH